MVRRLVGIGTLVFAGWLLAGEADAQSQSRCADCHFANPGSISAAHLSEWDLSAHGRRDVGCASCHGGVPIVEATQAGHSFVYDQLDDRLDTARARLAALFERIANPDAR